jgi:toxin FitB
MAAALTGRIWCLTFVSVGELTQWIRLRNSSGRNRAALEAWLSAFALVDSSHQAAHMWDTLSADGKRHGRGRPINDTWIAACCLADGTCHWPP